MSLMGHRNIHKKPNKAGLFGCIYELVHVVVVNGKHLHVLVSVNFEITGNLKKPFV